ncbi:hypothetical protein M0638_27965 [Roseomonas sp. NAR14]|uniref:Uncharacterized protein n=1 Tax=Roseomonas acroporae TaxID=2937791 RepID=A0A9X2C0J0_9PROT|nr:hypothetical protein [Roseomonas acroporae]MCK8788190.1 hypothetical protein [Roseomonas acroporae]
MTATIHSLPVSARARLIGVDDMPPLEGGGGGGNSGGMDGIAELTKRVDRVEGRLDKLDDRLRSVELSTTRIEANIAALSVSLDGLVRRVDGVASQALAKVPSGWTMFGLLMGTLVGGLTLVGAAITAARYFKLLPA